MDTGRLFSKANDCKTVTFLSPTLTKASILNFPSVSKIKYPFSAPAFSIRILINLANNLSMVISPENAWEAFSVVKSKSSRPSSASSTHGFMTFGNYRSFYRSLSSQLGIFSF